MLKYRVLTEIVGLKGDDEFKFVHFIFLKKLIICTFSLILCLISSRHLQGGR